MTHYSQGFADPSNQQLAFRVKAGFGLSPLDPTGVYTEISTYVRDISITRGKTDDLQDFSAGQATITLDNRDRRFDPSYVDGPYYGLLLPRTRVTVTSIANSMGLPLFSGFIAGWPQSFGQYGVDATCVIECYDLTAIMSQIDLPTDASKGIVLSLFGSGYVGGPPSTAAKFFRFGDFLEQADIVYDTGGTTNAYCSLGAGGGVIPATVSHIGPELSPELNGTSSYFVGPAVSSLYRTQVTHAVTLTPSNTSIAFGGWISIAPTTTNFLGLTSGAIVTVGGFQVGLNTAGHIGLYNASGVLVSGTTTVVDDNVARHIMFYYNATTDTAKIYINGVDSTGTSISSVVLSSDAIVFDSLYYTFYAQDWVFFLSSALPTVALWNSETPSLYPRILYGAGVNQALMSTYDRFFLLCDLSSFDVASQTEVETEADYLGQCLELNFAGKTLLQSLQDVARTEQGFLFTSNYGKLTFLPRYAIAESLIGLPRMTFTDNPNYLPADREDPQGEFYIGYTNFGFEFDDAQLANFTQVALGSGSQGSYEDSTSVTALGKKSLSIDTLLSEVSDAYDMSEALTNIYKDPILRIKEMTVMPVNKYQAQQLSLMEIGDLIAVSRLPQGLGDPVEEFLTVLQVKHNITPDKYVFSVYASARPVNSFFILGGYTVQETFVNRFRSQGTLNLSGTEFVGSGGGSTIETGEGRRSDDAISMERQSGSGAMSLTTSTNYMTAVTVGDTYKFYCWFKFQINGTRQLRIDWLWYNSSLALISTVTGSFPQTLSTADNNTGWKVLSETAVAPATAAYVRVKIHAISTNTVGDGYLFTDFVLFDSTATANVDPLNNFGYAQVFDYAAVTRYSWGEKKNLMQNLLAMSVIAPPQPPYTQPSPAHVITTATGTTVAPVTNEVFGYAGLQTNKIVFSANTPAQFGPNNITLIATGEMNPYFYGLAIANASKIGGPFFAQFDYNYSVGTVNGQLLRIVVRFKDSSNNVLATEYGDYISPTRYIGKAFLSGYIPATTAFVQIQIEISNALPNSQWWFTGFLFETPLQDYDAVYSPYPSVERDYFQFGEADAVYPYRVIDAVLAPFDATQNQIGTFTLGDLNEYFDGSALDSTDILGF